MRVGAPDQVQPGEEEAEEPMNSNKKVIKLLFASKEELLKKNSDFVSETSGEPRLKKISLMLKIYKRTGKTKTVAAPRTSSS